MRSSDCEDTCIYVRVSVDKGDGIWYLLRDDITTLCAEGGLSSRSACCRMSADGHESDVKGHR